MAAVPNPGVVAVLGGTGPAGSGLALRWAKAGINIVIGSRDVGRAQETAQWIRDRVSGANVEGAENAQAVDRADTIVLTVPFSAQQPTLKSIKASLRPGQTLVDVTVPLETTVGGRATRMLGVWEGSAAEAAAEAVPEGVLVAAAFHNVSAVHLEHLDEPLDTDVLVCGDKREAKARVAALVEAIEGARFVDAGPLSNARTVEALTALLIGINIRYKIPGAGLRITGLPAKDEKSS
jgi:NADPH-dependent F420 reductase